GQHRERGECRPCRVGWGRGRRAARRRRARHQQLPQAHQRQPAPAAPDRPLPPPHRRPGRGAPPGVVPRRGLRRGLRRRGAAGKAAGPGRDRLRLQPGVRRPGAAAGAARHLPGCEHLRYPARGERLRCRRLLRGPRAPGRPGRRAARAGPGGQPGGGPQRPAGALLLARERRAGQEPRHPPTRQRPRPPAALAAGGIRRLRAGRPRARRRLARRLVPVDDLRRTQAGQL
ncbi:MAG: hypothetical protein AVDCRST_MAG49-2342, partial [uncultured Thermomicrobiales bacterium]